MKPFENHSIQLKSGDNIYLATDGFRDQFGGKNNKMFSSRKFEGLLENISNKNLSEQKNILDKTFENWKGSNDQLDDITILGVRV